MIGTLIRIDRFPTESFEHTSARRIATRENEQDFSADAWGSRMKPFSILATQ